MPYRTAPKLFRGSRPTQILWSRSFPWDIRMRPGSTWGLTFELRRVRSLKFRMYLNNWSWLTRLFAYVQIGYYILNMTVNDPSYANRTGSCLGPDR